MKPEQNEPNFMALGLRPITRWVPDTRSPAFRERYRQQRATIAKAAENCAEVEWWERLQAHEGWV
jgi:Protein  of unknown function (DUF3018)